MFKKFLKKIKYPRFLLLILTFVVAYLIFTGKSFEPLSQFFLNLGYFGIFLTGMLYVYGFTAAPATALLLILAREQNIPVAGLIAGLGALAGDLIIFKFIRSSFTDEIKKLSKEKIVKYISKTTPKLLKKYLTPVLAAIFIAAPLPDEIGVPLLVAFSSISTKAFFILSYILNTAGIFIVLLIGKAI